MTYRIYNFIIILHLLCAGICKETENMQMFALGTTWYLTVLMQSQCFLVHQKINPTEEVDFFFAKLILFCYK